MLNQKYDKYLDKCIDDLIRLKFISYDWNNCYCLKDRLPYSIYIKVKAFFEWNQDFQDYTVSQPKELTKSLVDLGFWSLDIELEKRRELFKIVDEWNKELFNNS